MSDTLQNIPTPLEHQGFDAYQKARGEGVLGPVAMIDALQQFFLPATYQIRQGLREGLTIPPLEQWTALNADIAQNGASLVACVLGSPYQAVIMKVLFNPLVGKVGKDLVGTARQRRDSEV